MTSDPNRLAEKKSRWLAGVLLLMILTACGSKQAQADPFSSVTAVIDSVADTAETDEDETERKKEFPAPPAEADELFDDFIFNYASNEALQRERTVFPLPFYDGETPTKITADEWMHDNLFTQQHLYTLLFDREEEMDLIGDTTLTSVQVEWFILASRQVKRYYFERIKGKWMLEAINLRQLEKSENEDFVDFYTRFATDSLYQRQHIDNPLRFVTIDPDDEFSILETTMEADQWYAFRPELPTDRLSNINYGQQNEDSSPTKILKINSIEDGFSSVLYFRKQGEEWRLYKYEDASM